MKPDFYITICTIMLHIIFLIFFAYTGYFYVNVFVNAKYPTGYNIFSVALISFTNVIYFGWYWVKAVYWIISFFKTGHVYWRSCSNLYPKEILANYCSDLYMNTGLMLLIVTVFFLFMVWRFTYFYTIFDATLNTFFFIAGVTAFCYLLLALFVICYKIYGIYTVATFIKYAATFKTFNALAFLVFYSGYEALMFEFYFRFFIVIATTVIVSTVYLSRI